MHFTLISKKNKTCISDVIDAVLKTWKKNEDGRTKIGLVAGQNEPKQWEKRNDRNLITAITSAINQKNFLHANGTC